VPRVPGYQYIHGGDLGYQISAAPHCDDNITVAWKVLGITWATTVDYAYRQEISKNNSGIEREGRESICFARRPYIYQLFRDKIVNTSASDAPPLALRPPLKILSTPRPRRQALLVQLAHQQR
jgi:hypothetical protein